MLFPHSFHANNFWYLTIPVQLNAGTNTIRFAAQELPDVDGGTYISDRYTEPLRSRYAPIIDKVGVTPYTSWGYPLAGRRERRPAQAASNKPRRHRRIGAVVAARGSDPARRR